MCARGVDLRFQQCGARDERIHCQRLLPLHHPLRLIEEICMVDHLSGGRLEIGFGRGSSPVEVSFYGQDPAKAQDIYTEARALILQGLTQKTLTFEGTDRKSTRLNSS